MPIGELCNRTVAFATRQTPLPDAARLMRDYHVGTLVVVEQAGDRRIPVGILTDRDIVIEAVAQGVPAESLNAGDIMSEPLVVASESCGVAQALGLMEEKGVRRLPVTDPEGSLVGILTLDDLLEVLAAEVESLASIVRKEQRKEKNQRPRILV